MRTEESTEIVYVQQKMICISEVRWQCVISRGFLKNTFVRDLHLISFFYLCSINKRESEYLKFMAFW